jgi:glycosyltransferase involved in cell wall biosynthesis
MKPRILFIVQLPPPVHGVSEMNMHAINNPLWNKQYISKTLPLHFGQTLNDIGKITLGKVFHMIGFLFRLTYLLITFRPSLVYFTIVPTGRIFYRDALFTGLIKLFGPRIVFHLHKKGIEEMASSSKRDKWLLTKTFKGTKTICLSKKLTDDVRSIYQPRPFILPNGIDVVNQGTVKRMNSVPRILYLSNLVINKGIEVFLSSLADLHKLGCRFQARVVGGTVDYTVEQARAFCDQAGISHLVDIVGPRFGKDKFEELKKADIFVLPSFSECLPLSILEAMQFSLPVVATTVGGIPDIITDGRQGYLVAPGSVTQLSGRLRALLSNTALRIQMGNNARESFHQHYTLNKFHKGLNGIFEEVLNESR